MPKASLEKFSIKAIAAIFGVVSVGVLALEAGAQPVSAGASPSPSDTVVGTPKSEADAVSSVQIVNVTSVPVIALSLNGKKIYPSFPQGEYTADGPARMLHIRYLAENTATGAVAQSEEIKLQPNSHQTVVIMGDFSTDTPPGNLPQAGPPPPKPEKPYPPNVVFTVFPHDKQEGRRVALRIVNAMPGKDLIFPSKTGKMTIHPGESEVLPDQEPVHEYVAEVEGKQIDFLMKQEGGNIRNAMAIFYLKDGEPTLQRAFENR